MKLEQVPEWTAEEFEGTAPFEWLYKYADDGFVLARYVDKVSEQAKKYGIRNFKALWMKYQKSANRKNRIATENTTDFEGQPLELLVGEYSANDYIGIRGVNAYGEEITICNHPIMPTKRLINVDTNEVKVEIAYKRGRIWQTITQDKSTLATASRIVDLARFGIGVDSENAKGFVKYFTEVEHLNYDQIPEILSVGHLGWIADGSFAPYVEGLQFDGDMQYRKVYDAIKPHGSVNTWLSYAVGIRGHSKIVQIMLAASLASALIKPTDSLPFLVHLWGGSGAGKTVALKAAASVWGSPCDDADFIRTFNATAVGMEMAAGFCGSLPLLLDELQIAKDRKSFDDIIYMLTEGKGRTRGAKTGGLQSTASWRNTILTTGEMPIANSASGAGAVNRVIGIDCKEERLFLNPKETVQVFSQNYGFAGKIFIDMLRRPDNMALMKEMQREYFDLLVKGETTDKQALSASLILTADSLADLWIYGTGDVLTLGDIQPYLSTKNDADANRRALDWLYGFVAANPNRFYTSSLNPDIVGEVWGEYADDKITIIKAVFDAKMTDAGFNPTAFLSWAKRCDLLETSNDHQRCVKKKRINGGVPSWCVVIRVPCEMEMPPDASGIADDLPM